MTASRFALVVVAVCFLLNMIGRGVADSYVVFLLPLEREFGWGRSQTASVYSIYLLVNGLVAPLIGVVADRFGARIVYGIGMASLALGYSLASTISGLWEFYLVVGVLSGIGVAAMGMVPASALVGRWFHARLGTAIAVVYSGFGVGILVMVPFMQWLLEQQGWRPTYRTIGIALGILVPIVLLLPWSRIQAGPGGAAQARGSLQGSPEGTWTLRTAARTRQFWALSQVFFFTSFGMFAVIVQIVPFLVERGISPMLAASTFGACGMLSTMGVVGAGWLGDRIGYRDAVTLSFGGTLTGIALLVMMTWVPAAFLIVLFVAAFGVCQGARGPIVSTLCTRLFAGPALATIYGTIFAFNAFGAALGSWTSGVLHDLTGGYRVSFVLAFISISIALLPFWQRLALKDHAGK
jgi:MFS family permease